MTSTTASSTSADDAAVRALLPSAVAARVLDYEDELQRLRAKQPDDKHARQVRTADLEQLIDGAITAKLAKLEKQHPRFRISTVCDHLYRCGSHVPTRAVVARVLAKRGLYTKQLDVVATT